MEHTGEYPCTYNLYNDTVMTLCNTLLYGPQMGIYTDPYLFVTLFR